ncbi:toxin-antitoxin system, toxin component domain protein [Actinomyces sp. oral taxon 172 str. F0311]|nr:toxin-antitoxin system, toxin component domain protein [Actinomyces sp. oral taxon 172 str. F0311]
MAIGISRILRYCEGVVIHTLMTRRGERGRRPMGVCRSSRHGSGRRAHAPEVSTQWRVMNDGYE